MNNSKTDRYKKVFYPVQRKLTFSAKGIMTDSPHHMNGKGLPDHLKEVKRGKMKGFSKSSKKRMREAIFSHDVPTDFISYAVTLTVPGDECLAPGECKDLWERANRRFKQLGWCGFWRIEIQERGQAHWHLLLCAPPASECMIDSIWLDLLSKLPAVMVSVTCYQAEYINTNLNWDWDGEKWRDVIHYASTLEHEGYTVDYKQRKYKKTFVLPLRRHLIVGAQERATDIQSGDEQTKWMRYINDHCTKAKQAQVIGFGGFRHWGFINKKRLPPAKTFDVDLLNREWVPFHRLVSKWSRPRVKADCDFGYKLGFRTARGRSGSSVWFGDRGFYERAVKWAKDNPSSTRFGEEIEGKKPCVSFWDIYPLASGLQHLIEDASNLPHKLLTMGTGERRGGGDLFTPFSESSLPSSPFVGLGVAS